MVSLSPFIVQTETALRSQNRKSLVFNNKAVFIKWCCFHFLILKLNPNTLTSVYVGRPCFTLNPLFLSQVSKQPPRSAFQGMYKLSAVLMKPEILFKNLTEGGTDFGQPWTQLPSAAAAPPYGSALLHSRFGASSETIQHASALALVPDWDSSHSWQPDRAASMCNVA